MKELLAGRARRLDSNLTATELCCRNYVVIYTLHGHNAFDQS